MSKADTHSIGYDDFVEFGRRIGLTYRVIKQEIKIFQKSHPKAIALIEEPFLSDELKKQYITEYEYRCRMLNFKPSFVFVYVNQMLEAENIMSFK